MSPLRGSLVIAGDSTEMPPPWGPMPRSRISKRLCKVFSIPFSKAFPLPVERWDDFALVPLQPYGVAQTQSPQWTDDFALVPLQPRRGGISVEGINPHPRTP